MTSKIRRLIREDPSDANVEIAKTWLLRRKVLSTPVNLLFYELTKYRSDEVTSDWLKSWSKEFSLRGAALALRYLPGEDTYHWALDQLTRAGNSSECDLLWKEILSEYVSPEVLEGATVWLLQQKINTSAKVDILCQLLKDDPTAALLSLARKHLMQTHSKWDWSQTFLLSSYLKASNDESAATIAVRCLGRPIASYQKVEMAKILMEVFPERHEADVSRWLRTCWEQPGADYLLGAVADAAPNRMARLLFEWIDDHKKFKRIPELLLRSATTHCFDLSCGGQNLLGQETEQWLTANNDHQSFPTVLSWYMAHFERTVSDEVVALANRWVNENRGAQEWFSLLTHVLRRTPSVDLRELAQTWLLEQEEAARGQSLLALVRAAPDAFEATAIEWARKHPSDIFSGAIVLDRLKAWPSDELLSLAVELFDGCDRRMRNFLLRALIENEAGSRFVELGKERISTDSLERRWAGAAKADLIEKLLVTCPNDMEVAAAARRWLESGHARTDYLTDLADRIRKRLEERGLHCCDE